MSIRQHDITSNDIQQAEVGQQLTANINQHNDVCDRERRAEADYQLLHNVGESFSSRNIITIITIRCVSKSGTGTTVVAIQQHTYQINHKARAECGSATKLPVKDTTNHSSGAKRRQSERNCLHAPPGLLHRPLAYNDLTRKVRCV